MVSLYDACIPAYLRGLDALAGMLSKAAPFAGEQGLTEEDLFQSQLAERLHGLGRQALFVCGHAQRDPARVLRREPPEKPKPDELTFAALASAIDAAATYTGAIEREEFNQAAVGSFMYHKNEVEPVSFILTHSIPHFFFHLSNVYIGLKHRGLPLRKPDFLGSA